MSGRGIMRGGWFVAAMLLSPHAVAAVDSSSSPLGNVPWFDAARDELRTPRVPPHPSPTEPAAWSVDLDKTQEALSWPTFWLKAIEVVGWGLLLMTLTLVLVAIMRYLRQATLPVIDDEELLSPDQIRMQSLPFSHTREKTDLLSEARACYERGDLGMAIVYFYSYQLVKLDQAGVLRLARGKTNRQYIREARAVPEVHDLLRQSSQLFEAFFFGQHVPTVDAFEACWWRLDEFHARVQDLSHGVATE